jgi:hypothetical protein
LEGISVHTFSELFHAASYSTVVRAATFIDHLARHIKLQLTLTINNKSPFSVNTEKSVKPGNKKAKIDKDKCPYIEIASYIVEFLIERNVIRLTDEIKQEGPIGKKAGKYFKYKTLYVLCLFDLRLLAVKVNLPMVTKPISWKIDDEQKFRETGVAPQMVDLVGGYYTTSTRASMMINRYRMLTSRE